MANSGKVIGGIIGAVVGGPIGAGAGVFIGSLFDDEEERSSGAIGHNQVEEAFFLFRRERKIAVQCPSCEDIVVIENAGANWGCSQCNSPFIFNVTSEDFSCENGADYINFKGALMAQFYILGALAKCDGRICEKEIENVENIIKELGIDQEGVEFLKSQFLDGAKGDKSLVNTYARTLSNILAFHPQDRFTIIYELVSLAYADSEFHPKERALIVDIAVNYMGVEASKIDEIIATCAQEASSRKAGHCTELIEALKVLECTIDDSYDDVKASYKELCRKFHPDTISGKDLPEEFVKFATERFQEIQGAYEVASRYLSSNKSAA